MTKASITERRLSRKWFPLRFPENQKSVFQQGGILIMAIMKFKDDLKNPIYNLKKS